MQQTFELFSEYLSGSPSDKKLGKTLVFQTVDCSIDQRSLPKSRSSRASLQFPVGRIHRLLRKEITLNELAPVLWFIWPPSWNI